jgi:ubiquinone/menaquinone biosynthesis C-methylase UbiE
MPEQDQIDQFNHERYAKDLSERDRNSERLQATLNNLPQDGDLLEIGVWRGDVTREIRKVFNGKLCGMDFSMDVMQEAMPVLDEARAADLNHDGIPWDDASFDTVVCTEIIEHVLDTDGLLEEIRRVLRPGGRLIISTPNLSGFTNRLMLLLGWQPIATEVSSRSTKYGNPLRADGDPSGHIRNFVYRAFIEIVEANGFLIDKVCPAALAQRFPLGLLERIAGRLYRPLTGNPVIIAHKPESQRADSGEA